MRFLNVGMAKNFGIFPTFFINAKTKFSFVFDFQIISNKQRMKQMHILQLGPYPPPRGGVQTNMLAIQDELLASGHQSSIISITKAEKIGDEKNVYHPRSSFELIRLILTLEYDILHLHIGGGVPLRVQLMILACGLLAHGKSVMTFHSGGYVVSEEGKNAKYWTLRGFAFRRFNRIIVVNKMMIEMFEKFGVDTERIKLIYPYALTRPKSGIKIPLKFQEFWEKFEKIIITIGLHEPDYDLPIQVNVLEGVLHKFPKTGLFIVGSGSLEKELRELITQKSYAEHIFLAGDMDREIVLHLIEKADLMLRTTIFDGDAISVREALFLGTPVIATDNGMRPKGVKLFPIKDIDSLEQAIVEELSSDEKPKASDEDGSKNIRDVIELYDKMMFSGKNSVSGKQENKLQQKNSRQKV